MKKNFTTIATFGDIVWFLCAVKMLGGGNLYIKLNALDEFCQKVLGWRDAGPHSGRLTEKDYQFMKPFLEAQDYLGEVKVWEGETNDFPALENHWKYHLLDGWQGNQTECYAMTLGWNIYDPEISKKLNHEPWLTPVEPKKIPGRPIAVHRANRYNYNSISEDWYSYVDQGLGDYGFFLGTDAEHQEFEQTFKTKIHHQKVSNLLEMTQYIQGSEMIIANQSVHVAIAIGLGKSYRLEIRKDYKSTETNHGYGDNWFPRINGFYF